jgi:imidazolonepropionase-like amidohydrolase
VDLTAHRFNDKSISHESTEPVSGTSLTRGFYVKRRSISFLTLAIAAVLWLPSAVQVDGQAQRTRVIALRGGTVHTVTKGTIPNGTVLIRDGKIAAVGSNVSVPSDAEVVDATGRHVTPGIIDAHSHIANDSINEGGTTVSSMTGMEDVLDPTDISIYRDLAGGLTTANILHGSANPIGGKNAVIKLRWGAKKGDELLFEGAMPGIKFALGENPKDLRAGQITGPRRYPLTRSGVEYVIRDAFTRAKAYQKTWKDHEKVKTTDPGALPPRRDLQLDPLVEILEGKRLVHAHSYRADEILMLIRLADEMGFKIATFQHVLEGYKVAKEIAAHGAGASTFSDWWGYKIEADDAIPHNAAIMVRKGVLVSINSDSAEHARRLNTEAAKSMRWGGLNEDEALALVTINPAKQLRIDNRVGSLEVGKDADIAVWTHHPLSSYAIADRVYIDGRQYYDRKGEELRLTELKKEKAALAAAERGARGTSNTTPSQEDNGDQSETAGSAANSLTAPLPPPQPAAGAVLAITNATIHPVTSGSIEKGTIVIRGNKIEALGANVQAPQGAKIVDAKGGHVYPGFINARTTVGIGENGVRNYDDISEMHDWNQHLRTRVAYHSESETIAVARGTGVTTVGVAPTGGIMSGEFAVMNLDGWTWEEATLRPNAGIVFNFPALGGGGGRGGRGGRGGGGEAPDRTFDDIRRERDRRLDEVIRVLDQARAYGKAGPNRTTDWSLEALVPIVERKVPLIVSVAREQDIKDAVAFADRARVNIVLSGAIESNYAAQLLKDKNVPVILGNVLAMPSREDNFHASTYQLAGELAKAGVKFAFSSGDNTNVRLVPFQAAMSVAWGLNRDAAIKALTIDAAEILGVANRIGSLEPGKDANLFIANGDPLEVRTQVTHVVIQGKDVGIDNKHEALYRKYIARP